MVRINLDLWCRREESNFRPHPYQRVPVQLSLGKLLIINDIIIKFFFLNQFLRLECTQKCTQEII